MRYHTTLDGKARTIDLHRTGEGWEGTVDGAPFRADLRLLPGIPEVSLLLDGASYTFPIEIEKDRVRFENPGRPIEVLVEDPVRYALAKTLPRTTARSVTETVESPMPGRILRLAVAEGETVAENTVLAVIEAMKMENEIRSPRAARIGTIRVAEGDSVPARTPILTLLPCDPSEPPPSS